MTHDYTRHGTITLFAALIALTRKLITRTEVSHTHVEWLRFLKQIDRETPKDLDLHLIADNYATHKHPKVLAWLARHPRFKIHFTLTSSSWLNLIERYFADLTEDVIRSGSFTSVKELVDDIDGYLAERNASPKPYKWTAKGEEILEKIRRARAALEKSRPPMNYIGAIESRHTSLPFAPVGADRPARAAQVSKLKALRLRFALFSL